jgi:hypothetical protein
MVDETFFGIVDRAIVAAKMVPVNIAAVRNPGCRRDDIRAADGYGFTVV